MGQTLSNTYDLVSKWVHILAVKAFFIFTFVTIFHANSSVNQFSQHVGTILADRNNFHRAYQNINFRMYFLKKMTALKNVSFVINFTQYWWLHFFQGVLFVANSIQDLIIQKHGFLPAFDSWAWFRSGFFHFVFPG